jgi:hypothetical protein
MRRGAHRAVTSGQDSYLGPPNTSRQFRTIPPLVWEISAHTLRLSASRISALLSEFP